MPKEFIWLLGVEHQLCAANSFLGSTVYLADSDLLIVNNVEECAKGEFNTGHGDILIVGIEPLVLCIVKECLGRYHVSKGTVFIFNIKLYLNMSIGHPDIVLDSTCSYLIYKVVEGLGGTIGYIMSIG